MIRNNRSIRYPDSVNASGVCLLAFSRICIISFLPSIYLNALYRLPSEISGHNPSACSCSLISWANRKGLSTTISASRSNSYTLAGGKPGGRVWEGGRRGGWGQAGALVTGSVVPDELQMTTTAISVARNERPHAWHGYTRCIRISRHLLYQHLDHRTWPLSPTTRAFLR